MAVHCDIQGQGGLGLPTMDNPMANKIKNERDTKTT